MAPLRLRSILLLLICLFPLMAYGRKRKNKGDKGQEVGEGLKFQRPVYAEDIREDVPVGSIVATVHATSKTEEVSSTIQYALRKRKVDQYLNVPFRIDPKTGEVFTIIALDVNRAGNYILLSYAFAKAGKKKLKATTKLYLNIIPIRTPLANLENANVLHGYIDENLEGPLNVSVPLPRTKKGVRVFIPASNPAFATSIFRVDAHTGVVTTREPLDREERDVYELLIRIIHKGRTIDTRYIVHVLDLNDNPPRFYHHVANFYVYENTDCALPLNATDDDLGENAIVSYRIAWGGSRYFEIDPKRGVLTNIRGIDYERTTRIELVVHAYSGNLFSYTQVVVNVRDLNDNAPILQDFTVFYNGIPSALSGAEVVQVPAHDIDVTGQLTYGLIPSEDGNANNILVMDSKTGMISVDPNYLDQEGQQLRTTVSVWVTDGVHGAQAICRVEITTVSMEMLSNGVSVRIPGLTEDSFLRTSGLNILRRSLARTLRTKVRNLMIYNVQEGASGGSPLLNITFAAKNPKDNSFINPDNIINTIYFERKKIQTTSGLTIVPAEDDVCVAESCEGFQKCRFRKVYSDVNSVSANTNGRSVTFRGILPAIEQWCECPDDYRVNNCSQIVNHCDSNPCNNDGTCEPNDGGYSCVCLREYSGDNCEIDFQKDSCFDGACLHDGTCVELDNGNGFSCTCTEGYEGSRCEMTSRFFPLGAYMAFPTLRQKSTMKISLNFSTSLENGLLMYVARYSQLHDFFAIELVNGQVAFSFSVGSLIMRVIVGASEGINDRKWHLVELYYRKKVVEVKLDSCNWNDPDDDDDDDDEDDDRPAKKEGGIPCVAYATQAVDVNAWFLDVNTPLIVGSLPETQEETRILNRNFMGCIKDVRIDNKVLDFANTLADRGTRPGCGWYGVEELVELP